jgi:hypothetical protein
MKRRFSFPAGLLLLTVLNLSGAAPVKAAGIGVQLGVYGHNIPRAVAGVQNSHAGRDAGARVRSQMNPNTRSIRPDTAGESAATRSRKSAGDVKASRQAAEFIKA